MSNKANQSIPDNEDKKNLINGKDKNETKEDLKQEVIGESTTVMKTRSSRRSNTKKVSSDGNDLKSKKEEVVIEEINEEISDKIEESKKIDEPGIYEETEIDEFPYNDEPKPIVEEPKEEEINGSTEPPSKENVSIEIEEIPEKNNELSNNDSENKVKDESSGKEDSDSSFMEPLVLSPDDVCPELVFEESSDKESEKHSPVLSRCVTRRSQNRRIPTPSTPKVFNEAEVEKEQINSEKGSVSPAPKNKNSSKNVYSETDNSSTNVSMTVQVGGNETRTDFSEGESDLLRNLRSKGSNSSSRYLSSRRSLRSVRSDVHSKSLRDSLHRGKMYVPSHSRDSMERAPSVKRKDRSETPENRKKFKSESSGFLSKFSSPLSNLKYKFTTTPTGTSTPKLTSYKDEKNHIDGDYFDQVEMPQEVGATPNKWCEIM